MRILKKIIKWVLCIVLVLVVVFVGLVFANGYSMYKEALVAVPLEDKVASIKAMDGYCHIDDISSDFKIAIVSVEDKRFYSHSGFDFLSFAKASINNIVTFEITGGGSTITQQLAKNMYFTMEQTYTRKVAELLLAFDIERAYDKDEILELYLNIIYFGQGQNGITAACEHYFGCLPSEITFDQTLYLAGLPQAPSVYSADPVKADQRAKQVLAAMIKNGYEYEPENG